MDGATAAAALQALHAHLSALLPELLRLEEQLRACLALQRPAELLPILHQRHQQCVAAVALLRGLPAGAAGRELEGLQALLAARPFVESSPDMVRDVQNLMVALTSPGQPEKQPSPSATDKQPSLSATEKKWRQLGVQLAPRVLPRTEAQAALVTRAGPGTNGTAAASHTHPQQQMQQQMQPAQQAQQHVQQTQPGQHGAPLGLQLLMQQQAQPTQQAAPPSAIAVAPAAPPGAAPTAQAAGAAVTAATQAPGSGAQPLAAELLFSMVSTDALPLLPSIGMLPTLSQLLEEPMLTLSLQDTDLMAAVVAQATAVAGSDAPAGGERGGGPAAGPVPMQQEQAEVAPGMSLRGGGPLPSWLGLMPLPGGGDESLQMVTSLLQPAPSSSGWLLSGASTVPPPFAAGQAPPPASALAPQPQPSPALASHCPPAPQAVQQPAAADPARAGSGCLPSSSSANQAHPAGSGRSLSYRHVSFKNLQSSARGATEDSAAPSSGTPTAKSLPFVRPPAAAGAPPFLARPPPGALAAQSEPLPQPPGVATLAAPAAAPPPAAAAAAAAPPPAARVAVVQSGTAVRIAASTAAPAAAEEVKPERVLGTVGTADGPITYVSVHEASTSHGFSEGETSLTRLFAEVKATGVLPPPTIQEDSQEGRGDSPARGHSGQSMADDGASAGGGGRGGGGATSSVRAVDSQQAAGSAEGGARLTRQHDRFVQHSTAWQDGKLLAVEVPAEQEVLGGTKRRKGSRC